MDDDDKPMDAINKPMGAINRAPTQYMIKSPITRSSRHSIRLTGYDYSSPGAYFFTVCTRDRRRVFGDVQDNQMVLNKCGLVIRDTWEELPRRFPNIELDEFVIMPNHVHGIIHIVGAPFMAPNRKHMAPNRKPMGAINRAPTLGWIIRAFKAIATYEIHKSGYPRFKWQRNFYEHVIRSESKLNQTRQYILNNPAQWDLDEENPHRKIILKN